MNQQKIDQKLTELRISLEAGQKQMLELKAQQNALEATLLRISGAIQALSELRDELAD
jgi:hypothetical protein